MKKRADKFLTRFEDIIVIREGKQLNLKTKKRKILKMKKIFSS